MPARVSPLFVHLRDASIFNARLSTFKTSGSFHSITPSSTRLSTAAACSEGVGAGSPHELRLMSYNAF